MKDALNSPILKIFSTFLLSVMLLAPFVNYTPCRQSVDSFIIIVYVVVAIYILGKKIFDELGKV